MSRYRSGYIGLYRVHVEVIWGSTGLMWRSSLTNCRVLDKIDPTMPFQASEGLWLAEILFLWPPSEGCGSGSNFCAQNGHYGQQFFPRFSYRILSIISPKDMQINSYLTPYNPYITLYIYFEPHIAPI